MSARATHICGAEFSRLQDREPCPSPLHNWPLPAGYIDASEMATARIGQGWTNGKCPDCGVYGWTPGRFNGLAAESIEVKP